MMPSSADSIPSVPDISALTVRNLCLYLGGRQILSDVGLDVNRGSITGIVGPNGSGKTTLLRSCAGLLKPLSGYINLVGRDLHSLSPLERARRITYMPQNANRHPFTVLEAVLMGRYPHIGGLGIEKEKDRLIAEHSLERVDMGSFSGRTVETLSGGEHKRVLLARALAQDAEILILDEPTSELDIRHQLTTMSILQEEARKGLAVLITMHDLTLAARLCSVLSVMCEGQIVACGSPKDVLKPRILRDVFEVEAIVEPDPIDNHLRILPLYPIGHKDSQFVSVDSDETITV